MFLSFNLDINTSLQAVFTVVVHSYYLCEKQFRLGITDENVHRFMYIYFESNVFVFWSEYSFKKKTHTRTQPFPIYDHLSGLALTITQNNQAKQYDFHSKYKNSSIDNTPTCLLRDFLSPYFPRFL